LLYKPYTGVGSRETPPDIMEQEGDLAGLLAVNGWTLRSGGAEGSDDAFEEGCDVVGGSKEIYLPWPNFNGRDSNLIVKDPRAFEIASKVHPAFQKLTQGAQKLHSRNTHQVLGYNLNTQILSKFVVCWTPDGAETEKQCSRSSGGTRTAIVLASRNNIPVFNLLNLDAFDRLVRFVLSLS